MAEETGVRIDGALLYSQVHVEPAFSDLVLQVVVGTVVDVGPQELDDQEAIESVRWLQPHEVVDEARRGRLVAASTIAALTLLIGVQGGR